MSLPQKISANIWLAVLFLVLFVVSAYSPILNSSFKVIYDTDYIVDNPQVRDLNRIAQAFSKSLFKSDAVYRPLTVTSHAFEYKFFSLTPFFYYSLNILIHLANVLLVYAFINLLLRDRWAAFAAGLLFAIHPAQWGIVSFLSGRPDLLNAFFNLAALVCCAMYLRRLNGTWIMASVVLFACGLLAHEAREFSLLIFFFYFLFLAKNEDIKEIRWLMFLPYAVVTFLYMALRHGLAGIAWPGTGSTDLGLKLLSVLRSVVIETGNLLIPTEIHFRQTIAVFASPHDPLAIAACVFIVLIAGALWFYRKNLNAAVFFLIAWFLVSLWPLINAVYSMDLSQDGRLVVDGIFVYFLIIPLVAAVVLVFRRLIELAQPKNPLVFGVVTLAAVGCVALFFVLTYKNALQAHDEIALLEQSQFVEPPSAPVQYSLGLLYENKNSFGQAQYHFTKALAIDPNLVEARLGLGKTLYDQGHFLDAVKVYESILSPGKYQKVISDNLRSAYGVLTLNQEAIVEKNPQDINAFFSLGVFYAKLGEVAKAINAYQRVVELDADNQAGLRPLALRFQGLLYEEIGEKAKAQENFDRAR